MTLAPGSIVQIKPEIDMFGSCLLVVTEVRSWGVVGYIQVPNERLVYYRVAFTNIEATNGHVVWWPAHHEQQSHPTEETL